MEDSTTKIDNIIDQLMNQNYAGILKNLKKLLSKDANQSPRNMFLIDMISSLCNYHLGKYKKSEEKIESAMKNLAAVDLNFWSRYQFLLTIILGTTQNEQINNLCLDKLQESGEKVKLFLGIKL